MEKAIKAVSKLPEDRQNQLAELLLAAAVEEPLRITDEERRAIKDGLTDADAGRFAPEARIEALFSKHRIAWNYGLPHAPIATFNKSAIIFQNIIQS